MPNRSIFRQSEVDAIQSCLAANGGDPGQVDLGLLGTVDEALRACQRLFPDWWRHQIVSFVCYCTGCTQNTVSTRISKMGLTGNWKVRERWSKQ